MDIGAFFFGIALGAAAGALIAWLSGRVATARILARLEAERQGSAEKLALLARAESRLREAFSSLSAEALRQNNQSFLDLAQTAELRDNWFVFRDRRPELYGALVTYDATERAPGT